MLTWLHIRRRMMMSSKSQSQRLHSSNTYTAIAEAIQPLTKTQLKTLVLNQYAHGNFSNLIKNVVALPTVLFTACNNLATPQPLNASFLLNSLSNRFSIQAMARDLRDNRFDVGACCVTLMPSPNTKNGSPLVLPNLKLKVLIEAIRMVLEVVYDERFATFCYGGRVGMGRHTAIRIY